MRRLMLVPLGGIVSAALLIPAALLTPAQASTSPAQPGHTAVASVADPASIGSRHFDARTNYGAATGLLTWDTATRTVTVVVSLVDTERYPSTSSAWLCVGRGGGKCASPSPYKLVGVTNGARADVGLSEPLPPGDGAWVQERSVRSGVTYYSPWK